MERQQNLPTQKTAIEMMQGPVDAFQGLPEGGIDGARILRAGEIGAVTVAGTALFVSAGPQIASSIDRAVTPRAEAAVGGSQLLNVECVDNPAGASLPKYVKTTYAFTELSGIENGDARYAIIWNPDEMVPGLGQPDYRSSGDIRNLLSPLRPPESGKTTPQWIEGQDFNGVTTYEEEAPKGPFTVRATFEGKDSRNITFSKEYQAVLNCNPESGPVLPPPPTGETPGNPPSTPPSEVPPVPVCENGKAIVSFSLKRQPVKNKLAELRLTLTNNSSKVISSTGNGASKKPAERARAVGFQVDLPNNVKLPAGITRVGGREFIDLTADVQPGSRFVRIFKLKFASSGNISGPVTANLPKSATGFCGDQVAKGRMKAIVRSK